jgi:hypothetical protein
MPQPPLAGPGPSPGALPTTPRTGRGSDGMRLASVAVGIITRHGRERSQAIMSSEALVALIASVAAGLAVVLSADATASGPSLQTVDRSGDDRISKDEFYGYVDEAGLYRRYDEDGDGLMDDDELERLGLDLDIGWDEDRNSRIDSGEFWDGVFEAFDEDEDLHWGEPEWENFRGSQLIEAVAGDADAATRS